MKSISSVTGQLVDIENRITYPAKVTVHDGKIAAIEKVAEAPQVFIMPGFVDAHVHVESSMLVPAEFARLAVLHGTVATVSDPHEIANVLGVEGVEYMIDNAKKVPFKCYFGAPSCVPATPFETAGATIDVEGIQYLLAKPEIKYLAEMMNWPGVLHADAAVMKKIDLAKSAGKPIDGHAPGLKGEQAANYAKAGISTDHECYTAAEALDKLQLGMKVIIREGSAAKNFPALSPLIAEHYENMMFCSDDKHPDELLQWHINKLVARAVQLEGVDVFKALQMACVNPVIHYGLEVGLLRIGDPADFIVVNDLEHFDIKQTIIAGSVVAEEGKSLIAPKGGDAINQFRAVPIAPQQLAVEGEGKVNVIVAHDGELVTSKTEAQLPVYNGVITSDINQDILKITVYDRYHSTAPSSAFIKGFGLKQGALASSVAHDSHNIIAVGTSDEEITQAINALVENGGGVSVVGELQGEKFEKVLPLPIAGLMSGRDAYEVAEAYANIDHMAKKIGSTLTAPFMTLSFMALLVIPAIKMSDKGLFDAEKFEFISVNA